MPGDPVVARYNGLEPADMVPGNRHGPQSARRTHGSSRRIYLKDYPHRRYQLRSYRQDFFRMMDIKSVPLTIDDGCIAANVRIWGDVNNLSADELSDILTS